MTIDWRHEHYNYTDVTCGNILQIHKKNAIVCISYYRPPYAIWVRKVGDIFIWTSVWTID